MPKTVSKGFPTYICKTTGRYTKLGACYVRENTGRNSFVRHYFKSIKDAKASEPYAKIIRERDHARLALQKLYSSGVPKKHLVQKYRRSDADRDQARARHREYVASGGILEPGITFYAKNALYRYACPTRFGLARGSALTLQTARDIAAKITALPEERPRHFWRDAKLMREAKREAEELAERGAEIPKGIAFHEKSRTRRNVWTVTRWVTGMGSCQQFAHSFKEAKQMLAAMEAADKVALAGEDGEEPAPLEVDALSDDDEEAVVTEEAEEDEEDEEAEEAVYESDAASEIVHPDVVRMATDVVQVQAELVERPPPQARVVRIRGIQVSTDYNAPTLMSAQGNALLLALCNADGQLTDAKGAVYWLNSAPAAEGFMVAAVPE